MTSLCTSQHAHIRHLKRRDSETLATHYSTFAGAVLVIIMIFMAVTSSGASEMLAVSSLFTFDIYRRYIKPKASVSHFHALTPCGECCDPS